MNLLNPITLQGKYVTLVPLSQQYCAGLQEAVRDGELWKLWYTLIPTPEEMGNEIQRRLDLQSEGNMLPFVAINNQTQQIIGMTAYCHIDVINKKLDIGWTWFRKSAQRTALNTESKLLLLTHAFEILKCIAVGFRVHSLNLPSRKAVERLGAKLDGIMRNYSIMPDGHIRDMCLYSILPDEWKDIKADLELKLQQSRCRVD